MRQSFHGGTCRSAGHRGGCTIFKEALHPYCQSHAGFAGWPTFPGEAVALSPAALGAARPGGLERSREWQEGWGCGGEEGWEMA